MQASPSESPHAVLEAPWTYEVVELNIDLASKRVVMKLRKGAESATLVFTEVQQLSIDEGYTGTESGMDILDFSSSDMEHARVRVGSFEQDPAIRFWAKNVVRVC
jgi:hypothetical protein